jgi:hypothetical protein
MAGTINVTDVPTTTTTTTTGAPTFSLSWNHSIPGTGTSTLSIYKNGNLEVNSSTSGGGPYTGVISGLTATDVITYSLFGQTVNYTSCVIYVSDDSVGIIDTLTDCNLFSASVDNLSGITLSDNGSLSASTDDYIDECP